MESKDMMFRRKCSEGARLRYGTERPSSAATRPPTRQAHVIGSVVFLGALAILGIAMPLRRRRRILAALLFDEGGVPRRLLKQSEDPPFGYDEFAEALMNMDMTEAGSVSRGGREVVVIHGEGGHLAMLVDREDVGWALLTGPKLLARHAG